MISVLYRKDRTTYFDINLIDLPHTCEIGVSWAKDARNFITRLGKPSPLDVTVDKMAATEKNQDFCS